MPRAKRNKVLSLTKTPKRNTRTSKSAHIEAVQEAASNYPTIVVFYVANLRNTHLQEIRSLWKENSKVIFGKNKVVQKALGLNVESEVRQGLSGISKKLKGPVGILFTKSQPDEIVEWFDDYAKDDFARAGNVATKDVILEAGEFNAQFFFLFPTKTFSSRTAYVCMAQLFSFLLSMPPSL